MRAIAVYKQQDKLTLVIGFDMTARELDEASAVISACRSFVDPDAPIGVTLEAESAAVTIMARAAHVHAARKRATATALQGKPVAGWDDGPEDTRG